MSRGLAAAATLGLSEVALSHARAEPHWIYFLEGRMVYTSLALDCKKEGCRISEVKLLPVEGAHKKTDK